MLLSRVSLAFLLATALMASPAFGARSHHGHTKGHVRTVAQKSSKHHSVRRSRHHYRRRSRRLRGQQAIKPERVTQIQEALIREHYLNGEPNGKWDAETKSAMQKYQSDNGWQTKLAPDSRALVKLGLGPDYSDAINAKTAYFGPPPPVTTIPTDQAAGFADAAGTNR